MEALKIDTPQDLLNDAANGKRRLIEAAITLAGRGMSLSSMGKRELAREAGLNHNTFYRHFRDMEDLALQVAQVLAHQVMDGMRQVRERSQRHADATTGAVDYFLDFVSQHPELISTGVRELHGGTPGIRRVMRRIIDEIAQESVEQINAQGLVPGAPDTLLLQATQAITYTMFFRALEFLDQADQREKIKSELVHFIRVQFIGSMAAAGDNSRSS